MTAAWSAPASGPAASSAAMDRACAAELLRRCGLGDETAFAALYDQTCLRLFALVLKVLRDPACAEQVTRQVYLHVWRHSARYDPDRGSALAWIMTTAHWAAVDRLRNGPAPQRPSLTSGTDAQAIAKA